LSCRLLQRVRRFCWAGRNKRLFQSLINTD
jgi:hypothetical protein